MALEVFITPKPRETIFSLLTRAHILLGSLSPLVSLQVLTGHRGYKPLSSLPSNIRHICKSLNLEINPAQIIQGHTLFPFYNPFLPAHRRDFVIDGMLDFGATKSRIGLLKSHCGAADQLAYCSECVKDDIYKYGFPYWHREHMLVGVELCHLHGLALIKIKLNESQFGDRCLQLPGELKSVNTYSETQYDRLRFVASQVAVVANTEIQISIDLDSYSPLLAENDLLTNSSHVRMKKLQDLIKDWLTPLAEVKPFNDLFVALNVERNWVASIVAGKAGMHHPLKHIVLWGALNTDFYSLINSVQCIEQLRLPLRCNRRCEITEDVLQAAILSCGSATAAARLLNCSTQTVLALMEKFGIAVKRRPKKLNKTIINKIIKRSLEGLSTSKIAAECGLSIATVNRIKRSNV